METLRRTCGTVPQPSELRFGVVRAVGRGIAVLNGGPRRARVRGRFDGFCSPFHNGKCHWVADGEMFPIRMRIFDNVSVRQTYRWKARFVGFLAIYSLSRSHLGFWEISKNVTIVLRHLRSTPQGFRSNMHNHEWTPRSTACYSPPRRGPFPNYFRQTCYSCVQSMLKRDKPL